MALAIGVAVVAYTVIGAGVWVADPRGVYGDPGTESAS
jgi:hypothetical protein